jgi:hypothetical protein
MNGQEPKQITTHPLGTWLETERGVVFRLIAQPQRTFDGRHVSQVQFLDKSWDVLAWRTDSARVRPGWFIRLLERLGLAPRWLLPKTITLGAGPPVLPVTTRAGGAQEVERSS